MFNKKRLMKKYELSDRAYMMLYYDRNEERQKALRDLKENAEKSQKAFIEAGVTCVEAAQRLQESFSKIGKILGEKNENK